MKCDSEGIEHLQKIYCSVAKNHMDEMRTSFKRQNLRKKNGSAKIW
jgi:hypothetical protein